MSSNFTKIDKGLTVGSQIAAPVDPQNGDVYYDTSLNTLRARLNGQWVNLGAGSFSTGMTMEQMGAVAPTGWIFSDGLTIGSAASGATNRANDDTFDLYVLLWNGYSNTILPIQDSAGVPTTRGATAEDDFNANKRLSLPGLQNVENLKSSLPTNTIPAKGMRYSNFGSTANPGTNVIGTGQVVPGGFASTLVTLPNIVSMDGGMTAGGSQNIIVPRTGVYNIHGMVQRRNGGNTTQYIMYIYINGSPVNLGRIHRYSAGEAAAELEHNVSFIQNLTAGSSIQLYYSTVTQTSITNCRLIVEEIPDRSSSFLSNKIIKL